jgi:hypothetical protein
MPYLPSLPARVLAEKLDGDPNQDQPSDGLDKRNPKKLRDYGNKNEPERDCPKGAADSSQKLLARRKSPHCHGDEQSIVAGQTEVEDHDAEPTDPKLRIREEFH